MSELMKYSVKPLYGPEPTTSAGPNTVFATLISVPLGLALAAAACVVEACAAAASPSVVARAVSGTSARQMGLTDMKILRPCGPAGRLALHVSVGSASAAVTEMR